jgi:high affinity Mn2+ porin
LEHSPGNVWRPAAVDHGPVLSGSEAVGGRVGRSKSVCRLQHNRPACSYRRQILSLRCFRSKQIRAKSTQGFYELGVDRYGLLRLWADAWGYTYGSAAEWYQGPWTLRGGVFDISTVPNGTDLDTTFSQFQLDGEIERRYSLWNRAGKIAVTGFLTRARLGTYQDAIALAQATGGPADIAAVRQYRSRTGLGMNLEQELMDDLGFFARAGFASGDIEPDSYTDIDRTVAAGLSLTGKWWGRSDDTVGLAAIANAITPIHAEFLNKGGLGILIGDVQLPHPGLEQIIETYYQFPIYAWKVMFDYQFIVNPAYNRDRGPVSIDQSIAVA